jgi:hypothetical protein
MFLKANFPVTSWDVTDRKEYILKLNEREPGVFISIWNPFVFIVDNKSMVDVRFSVEKDRKKCEIFGPSNGPIDEDIIFCFLLLKDIMKYTLILLPVNIVAKSGEDNVQGCTTVLNTIRFVIQNLLFLNYTNILSFLNSSVMASLNY